MSFETTDSAEPQAQKAGSAAGWKATDVVSVLSRAL